MQSLFQKETQFSDLLDHKTFQDNAKIFKRSKNISWSLIIMAIGRCVCVRVYDVIAFLYFLYYLKKSETGCAQQAR